MTNSLLVQTSGSAPAGTPTAMRASTSADLRMVAGLEAAMNDGYSAGVAARLALLAQWFALSKGLRDKFLTLHLAHVAKPGIDPTKATRVYDFLNLAEQLSANGADVPILGSGTLQYLDFNTIAKGLKAPLNPATLRPLQGVNGMAFGVIARKLASQGANATANPSIAMRFYTDDATRPEIGRISVNNNGNWSTFLRYRQDTSATYVPAPASGAVMYNDWDHVLANWTATSFDQYINGGSPATVAVPAGITTLLGSGIGEDWGRNSVTDAASSQLLGHVHASYICRATLTAGEVTEINNFMGGIVASLNVQD